MSITGSPPTLEPVQKVEPAMAMMVVVQQEGPGDGEGPKSERLSPVNRATGTVDPEGSRRFSKLFDHPQQPL
jgi:hypothetical protein